MSFEEDKFTNPEKEKSSFQPLRIILVGPAAAGKDVARQRLQKKLGLVFHPSYTTRLPRAGEKDGKDYYFISQEKFDSFTKENLWKEHASFGGKSYGTL